MIFYSIQSIMDLFDGSISRFLNKESVLGSCLDMFTDLLGNVIIVSRIYERIGFLKGILDNEEHMSIKIQKEHTNEYILIPTIQIRKILYHLPNFRTYLFFELISHLFLFTSSKILHTSHKKVSMFFLKIYYYTPILVVICAGSQIYLIIWLSYLSDPNINNQILFFFKRATAILFNIRMFFNLLRMIEGIWQLSQF